MNICVKFRRNLSTAYTALSHHAKYRVGVSRRRTDGQTDHPKSQCFPAVLLLAEASKNCGFAISEDDSLETGVWFAEDPVDDVLPRRGTEVVLNCSATTSDEFPAANVTWRKNGQPLEVDTDQRRVRQHAVDGSLLIRRVQRLDNGYYQCSAAVQGLGMRLGPPMRLHVAGELSLQY